MCCLMSPLQTQWANRKPKQSISSWAESERFSSPVMSHPAWLAHSPPRSRCGSILTKQACEEQTPTRLHSRLCHTKQGLLLHICGQTMDHTGGANQDAHSLWACFLSRVRLPQSGKGSSSWSGLLLPPLLSLVLWFVQHNCMHRAKEKQQSFWTGSGQQTQPKLYFYIMTLPAVFY